MAVRNASNVSASDNLDVAIYASLNPTDDADGVLLNRVAANLSLASDATTNVTVPITMPAEWIEWHVHAVCAGRRYFARG